MNFIQNVHEPLRLLLVWQSANLPRARRAVGMISRPDTSTTHAMFEYLTDSADFAAARLEGFVCFPSFPQLDSFYELGVLDVFNKRLPPNTRGDYAKYLEQFRLRPETAISDMGLLAYTGAKLPSDGFSLIDPLDDIDADCEVLLEVAGFRHKSLIPSCDIALGSIAHLQREDDNEHDSSAVAIYIGGQRVGYVPKQQAPGVRDLMTRSAIELQVERINGSPERPVIYLFAKIRPRYRGIFAPRREFGVPA